MTAVIVQQPKVTAQIVVEETTTQVVVTPKTTLELTLAGTQGPAGIQGPVGPVGPPGPSSNPEGTDGQVQYNNGGSFGGASSLYYDDVNDRVGIGTSSPTEKFHLSGGVARIQNNSSNWLDINANAGTGNEVYLSNRFNSIVLEANSGAADPYIGFNVAGSRRMVINNNGYVGIGTSVPDQRLTVSGYVSINNGGLFVRSSTTDASRLLDVRSIYGTTILNNNVLSFAYGYSPSQINATLLSEGFDNISQRRGTNSQTFNIYNTYTDGSNYERGFLKWNTNVLEIGTEALGTGTVRDIYFPNTTVKFKNTLDLNDNTSKITFNSQQSNATNVIQVNGNGSLTFTEGPANNQSNGISYKFVGKAWTAGTMFAVYKTTTELFNIKSDGNVGINTASPSYKLHISGPVTSSIPSAVVALSDTTYTGTTRLQAAGYYNGSDDQAGLYMSGPGNQGINMVSGGNRVRLTSESGIFKVWPTTGLPITHGNWETNIPGKVFLDTTASAGFVPLTITTNASTIVPIITASIGTGNKVFELDDSANLNLYNTYTDASNYERGFFRWNTNVFEIGADSLGTGTNRSVAIINPQNNTILKTHSNGAISVGSTATGDSGFFDVYTNLTNSLNQNFSAASFRIKATRNSGDPYALIASDGFYGWSPTTTTISVTPDTGLARYSAGVVKVTDGSTGYGTFIAGAGTESAPSYADSNGFGMFFKSGRPAFSHTGGIVAAFNTGKLAFKSTAAIVWTEGDPVNNTIDTGIYRDAASTIALRYGINSHNLNIYNTYTDASNYERAFIKWDTNVLNIGTEALGTGTVRSTILSGDDVTIKVKDNFSHIFLQGSSVFEIIDDQYHITGANQHYVWTSSGQASTSSLVWDLGFKRDSAGVLKITDGSTGTGDLIAGTLTIGNLIAQDIETTGQDVHLNADDTGSAFIHSGSQGAGSSLYLAGAGDLSTAAAAIGYTGISIRQPNYLGWTSGSAINTANDLYLYRDAANTLAQRNSTNAQVFNLYNTYTDASNYERAYLKWNSNRLEIGTEALGTGSQRGLDIISSFTRIMGDNQQTLSVGNHVASATNGFVRIAPDAYYYANAPILEVAGPRLTSSNPDILRLRTMVNGTLLYKVGYYGKIDSTPADLTSSSTDDYGIQLAQTLNVATANPGAEYRALKINVTETDTTGWDDVYLFDAQVGGVSKTYIENDGDIRTFGVFGLDASGVASYYVRTGAIQHYQGLFAGGTTGALGLTNGADWAVRSTGAFGWSSTTTAYSAVDLKLWRDAPYTLAQRFGTNPQTFNIYNTYTDASNYERGFLKWDTNEFVIGTEAAGTGTQREIKLNYTTTIDGGNRTNNYALTVENCGAGNGGILVSRTTGAFVNIASGLNLNQIELVDTANRALLYRQRGSGGVGAGTYPAHQFINDATSAGAYPAVMGVKSAASGTDLFHAQDASNNVVFGVAYNGDVTFTSGIYAGGSLGTAGQVLTSNGTTVSWQDSAGEFTALTDTPANYTGHAGKLVQVNATATALEFTDQVDLDEIVFDATTAPANGTILADTFPMYLTATGTSPNRELALKVKTQDDQEIIIASVLV